MVIKTFIKLAFLHNMTIFCFFEGRKVIEGLNLPMCGTNNYLSKDVTFSTQNNSFTVIFQRRQAGLYTKASFNLTFFSFFAGGKLFKFLRNFFRIKSVTLVKPCTALKLLTGNDLYSTQAFSLPADPGPWIM